MIQTVGGDHPVPANPVSPSLAPGPLKGSAPLPLRGPSRFCGKKREMGGSSMEFFISTLLFGIGPHGVPKAAASIPKYNLDITPGCFSLETATALGAVCGAFAARMDLIQ